MRGRVFDGDGGGEGRVGRGRSGFSLWKGFGEPRKIFVTHTAGNLEKDSSLDEIR